VQIKRLRLTGFKSFVEPADLRIEPGLTGIVGPNGCGKSNLLEALRWTMGESSAKSMRGAGMDDVIFAGTATRPQRDFAEVSLLIDGVADGTGESDETEVVRRIERGTGSAYRINGRDVRAKDVSLLFADAATGAHSPALVSQGRIGAVIAARPAERRAMLEEAAGIAGLHVRRKDAEQKLRATEVNLAKLDDLIADQEQRVAALRRQAKQAGRYRALSDQIRDAEARMIFARWRDAAAAADLAKAEASRAEAEVAATAEAQRAAAAHQADATDRLAAVRAVALAARDRVSEAGHSLATLRAERAGVDRRIAQLGETRDRITADREREGALAHDAAGALARLSEESKKFEQHIADAANRQPALEATLVVTERATREAEVTLAQALAAQASEVAEARVAEAALSTARARAERTLRDQQRIEAEIAGLSAAAPFAEERRAAVKARDEALLQAEAARAALASANGVESGANNTRDHAQSARATAHADLTAIDSESAALQRSMRDVARDRVLDKLRVDPGYERALAAALGDDLEVGLEPGSSQYWGGADALPGDPTGPAGAAALSRHVQAPPALARRLAQVFVTEVDGGVPLAVGQRLVTMAGGLRRWDGFVARSGGAAAAERLERINRLHSLDKQRPAAAVAVAAAEAELARIDAVIADARVRATAARRVLETAEVQTREAIRREDRAAAAIERVDAQRADLDARRRRIDGERNEAIADVTSAQRQLATLPDGTDSRARVGALQADADTRRTAVAQARADQAAVLRDLAADRERLAVGQADARNWHNRAGEAARRIADMAGRETALEEESAILAARPAILDRQIAELEAMYDAARTEAATVMAAEQAGEAERRALEQTARQTAEALSQARETRAGAAARLESQELRRVEMGRVSGERFECPPVLLPERIGFDATEVRGPADESARHERLSAERDRIGPVNLVAEIELAEIETARDTNIRERDELAHAVNRLRGSIGTLNREGRQRLLAAFEAVNGHFRRLFMTLFNGGQAHLALVDSDDPLEAGLEIMAQPPGKKLQSLTLLSGGEQALTAVALIFGLFLTNPAPICVLDEVDAPLDDANIERFCDLLDAMTQETRTRYLIVTHNAVTMSRMHRLFGVTMVEPGVSRLVSVDLGGAGALLAA